MMQRYRIALLLLLLPQQTPFAAGFTGRFAMLGTTAVAEEGDVGYRPAGADTLSADQQSVRLMFDEVLEQGEWSVHLQSARQHLSNFPVAERHSSDLFRYRLGGGNWLDERGGDTVTTIDYALDRLVYRRRFERYTLGLGRQPIDWGSGRFWQPLNVFGAFAPTDLDTDYKPGIDAVTVDAYPGAFSSLSGAYVLAPKDDAELENSSALHYRRQAGAFSELSLLAGSVVGNRVVGAAFESDWGGMGWRLEGVHYTLEQSDEQAFFWIAGIDTMFADGTMLAAEWYDNSRGATSEAELGAIAEDPLVAYGLQQQLGRHVLGVSLQRDLTPLLNGGYTLLAGTLRDGDDRRHFSLLHQLNLTYSVSDESDLLFSLLYADGKGLNAADEPQSEFGHLPTSATLRLRFYF
jgi:hypothetical protein